MDALIPHAGYDAEGNYYGINDIALVRVLRDIVFNENVQPIKLPDSDRNYDNYPFIVTGWGKDEVQHASYHLNFKIIASENVIQETCI